MKKTFEDVYVKKLYGNAIECENCHGSGIVQYDEECPVCKGDSFVIIDDD